MKADVNPTTTQLSSCATETPRLGLSDELDELVDAAGLMVLAMDGLREGYEVMGWHKEALLFGANLVHDRAERVAAAIGNREPRWRTEGPADACGQPEATS